jgi:regulatory protein
MRKITAIEVQKKNRQRVNIFLDGEFGFGLSRIVAAWLNVGQELGEEKIASLQAEDAREVALQKALNFLSYRARSVEEIRQNLRKHEMPEAVIEETLERLQKAGLANDEQFAQAWVENRSTFRPRSHRALSMELRRKGLDEQVIQTALAEATDEGELAYQAALRKARRFEGLEWPDFRRKLSEFLARRGFGYEVIGEAVRRVWRACTSEQEQAQASDRTEQINLVDEENP